MQYKFPNRFIRPPKPGNKLPEPNYHHPDLQCEFLVDDQRTIKVDARNSREATKQCVNQLTVGEDKLLGYRWNDVPVSRYAQLHTTLCANGLSMSIERFESTMDAFNEPAPSPMPDFYDLYNGATNQHLSPYGLAELAAWWKDPEGRDCRMDAANCVLKVIPAPGCGGYRVICPNGHTISKTDGQRIYYALSGRKKYGMTVDMPNRVKAREQLSKGEYTSPRYAYVRRKSTHIEIGCQKIPLSAIYDLAEREGWDK